MQNIWDPVENLTALRPEARIGEPATHLLGWNVPPEELSSIPDHWLSQPEPHASLHYLLGTLYIAFMFVALIGNGLVLWVFTSAKSLRSPSNVFVINLALCDFMMMSKTPIFIYNSFNHGYALGSAGCQIFALVGALSGIGAAITNACIAYDRYHVIANPLEGKLTMTKAIFIVILIWFYTIPWALFPYFKVWGRFVPEGFLTSCTFDYLTDSFDNRLFVGTLFTFSYCIPMMLIIYYYSQIVTHVFSHEKALRAQAKKMNVESLRSNQKGAGNTTAEVRIAKAAITICFLFVAAWTPYGTMSLIGSFGNKLLLTPGVTMIPACTCKFVACLDPYVYAISHPRYRIELQKRLPWLAISEKEEKITDATSMVTTDGNVPAAQQATA